MWLRNQNEKVWLKQTLMASSQLFKTEMDFMKRVILLTISIVLTDIAYCKVPKFLEGSLFEKVGTEKNIDPLLLYSISIVESGTSKDSKYISPTPLVLRSDEGAEFFDTHESAKLRLIQLQKKYKNIDVGICQRNLKWNPHETPYIFLDARTCLEWAADVINTNLKIAEQKNLSLAHGIGLYHTWADRLGSETYGLRVLKVYENLSNFQ